MPKILVFRTKMLACQKDHEKCKEENKKLQDEKSDFIHCQLNMLQRCQHARKTMRNVKKKKKSYKMKTLIIFTVNIQKILVFRTKMHAHNIYKGKLNTRNV